MASKPGILSEWPWAPLGNFKYVLLAPWVLHSTYSFIAKDANERNIFNFMIFPFLLSRWIHFQIWTSISRYRNAKGDNRIIDKSMEFDLVDRSQHWDDQIIFNGIIFYLFSILIKQAHHMPLWRTDGVIMTIILHIGPVEFLYYWKHRALHHHYLYSRYHSHHHSNMVTEALTSVDIAFAELTALFVLFAIPILTTIFNGTASIASIFCYATYIDFMSNMIHCNFEFVPKWIFSIFPPLKYLMFTPTYHSLHHSQLRTNFTLFVPLYDYIYNTRDKYTDKLYEISLQRKAESPDVVHLTHLTAPESIYHLRLGFAIQASNPRNTSEWYMWLMWPITLCSMIITRMYGRAFVVERNVFNHLKMQIWAIPKYNKQYLSTWERGSINSLIEKAILEAEEKGTKVVSLGLLNQDVKLNGNGELYIKRHPQLKVKIVDGSSLVVAVVLNTIPKGTTQVLLKGNLSKVVYSIVLALCKGGIKVTMSCEDDYEKLKARLTPEEGNSLVLSKNCTSKIWLVGDGLNEADQLKAPKGTLFIPFSQFPPKKMRKDCTYYYTPSMIAPKNFENVDSCENWLPRRVISAWRIAGIIHALEDWKEHECGNMMFDIDKIWQATLRHGFRLVN